MTSMCTSMATTNWALIHGQGPRLATRSSTSPRGRSSRRRDYFKYRFIDHIRTLVWRARSSPDISDLTNLRLRSLRAHLIHRIGPYWGRFKFEFWPLRHVQQEVGSRPDRDRVPPRDQ